MPYMVGWIPVRILCSSICAFTTQAEGRRTTRPRRNWAQRRLSVPPTRMGSLIVWCSLCYCGILLGWSYIINLSHFFFSAKKSYSEIQEMSEETFPMLLQQHGWRQQTRCWFPLPPQLKRKEKKRKKERKKKHIPFIHRQTEFLQRVWRWTEVKQFHNGPQIAIS